jgi:hypothetical protein
LVTIFFLPLVIAEPYQAELDETQAENPTIRLVRYRWLVIVSALTS